MIKKVLVATDGSEHSGHAVDYARDIAAKWGAELVVLTVIPLDYTTMFPTEGFTPMYHSKFQDDVEKAYKSRLDAAVNKIEEESPEQEVRARLEEGRPAEVIVKVADEENADIIVMGSRGMGGITGWILGSTCKRVVDTCTRPILIVK